MGSDVPLASHFTSLETVQCSSVVKNSSTVSLNDAYFRVHFLFSINYARQWFPKFRRKFPRTMDPKVSRYIRLLQCAHTPNTSKMGTTKGAKCVKATSPFFSLHGCSRAFGASWFPIPSFPQAWIAPSQTQPMGAIPLAMQRQPTPLLNHPRKSHKYPQVIRVRLFGLNVLPISRLSFLRRTNWDLGN